MLALILTKHNQFWTVVCIQKLTSNFCSIFTPVVCIPIWIWIWIVSCGVHSKADNGFPGKSAHPLHYYHIKGTSPIDSTYVCSCTTALLHAMKLQRVGWFPIQSSKSLWILIWMWIWIWIRIQIQIGFGVIGFEFGFEFGFGLCVIGFEFGHSDSDSDSDRFWIRTFGFGFGFRFRFGFGLQIWAAWIITLLLEDACFPVLIHNLAFLQFLL